MRARRAWSTSAGGLGASGGAVCAKHAAATSTAIAIRNLIPLLYERVSCTVLEPRHLTIGCSRSVLHLFRFFAARDDFGAARVRRTKENSPARQRWEWVKDTGSPGTGRKSFYSGASFAPFRSWAWCFGCG